MQRLTSKCEYKSGPSCTTWPWVMCSGRLYSTRKTVLVGSRFTKLLLQLSAVSHVKVRTAAPAVVDVDVTKSVASCPN